MLEFLWDLHQQKGVAEAKADASTAKDAASSQGDRIRELEFTVHCMALISQAMWELLRSRFDLEEEDLLARMREIDLRDGKLDGRMQTKSKCHNCDRGPQREKPAMHLLRQPREEGARVSITWDECNEHISLIRRTDACAH